MLMLILLCFAHVLNGYVFNNSTTAASLSSVASPSTTVSFLPALSTETVYNSAWTGNTVMTTTAPGSSDSTVLPILYGCSACGGNGYGLALAGLPAENPGDVLFALSSLPAFVIGTDGEPRTISNAALVSTGSSTTTSSISTSSSLIASPLSGSLSTSNSPSSVSSSSSTGPSSILSTSSTVQLSSNTSHPSTLSAQSVSEDSAGFAVSLGSVSLTSLPASSTTIDVSTQVTQVGSSNTDQSNTINATPDVLHSTLQFFTVTETATVSADSTETFDIPAFSTPFTVTAPQDHPTTITTLATYSILVSSTPVAEAASISAKLSLYLQSIATQSNSSVGAYGGMDGPLLNSSAASYARLPACTAKQQALIQAHPNTTETFYLTYTASGPTTITGQGLGTTALTFTGPSTNTHAYFTMTDRQDSPAEACCGVCAIYFNNVQLFYWPVPGAITECVTNSSYYPNPEAQRRRNRRTLNVLEHNLGGTFPQDATELESSRYHTTVPARMPPGNLELRGTNDSFPKSTVIDGFTIISPSVYVNFGDVSASDACGQVGSIHSAVKIVFAPDELSTVLYKADEKPSSFDYKNLPCPPLSIFAQNWYANMGAAAQGSYNPTLAPPSRLLAYDSEWSTCLADMYQGYDPPIAMSPAAALVPSTTNANHDPKQTTAEQVSPIPPVPVSTHAPDPKATDSGPNNAPTNPSDPSNPPSANVVAPTSMTSHTYGDPPIPSAPNQPAQSQMGQSQPVQNHPTANQPVQNQPDQSHSAQNQPTQNQPIQNQPAQNQAGQDPTNNPSSLNSPGHAVQGQQPGQQQGQTSSEGDLIGAAEQASIGSGGGRIMDIISQAYSPQYTSAGGVDSGMAAQQQSQPHQNQAPKTVIAGGLVFSPVPSSLITFGTPAVVVQGQTLTENGPSQTIGNIPVAYRSGSVYAGSDPPVPVSTHVQAAGMLPVAGMEFSMPSTQGSPANIQSASTGEQPGSSNPGISAAAPALVTIGGQTYAANPAGFAVAGSTLSPGGPPITISGTTLSLGSSALIIDSSTITFAATPTATALTIDGYIITADPAGFAIAGTDLSPGGPGVTISGIPPSLGSSALIIGSSTITFAATPTTIALTLGGHVFTANPTGFAVAGTVLSPGGPGITISGTPISLLPSAILIDGSTISIPSPPAIVITVGGQILTPVSNGLAIAGTTLHANGPGITISGTPVSLTRSAIIVGSRTILLANTASVFAVGIVLITANPTGFVVAGASVVPGGPAITVAGTAVSLDRASHLVIGTATIPMGASVTQGGVAGAIMSAFGGGGVGTSVGATSSSTIGGSYSTGASSGVLVFQGGQGRIQMLGWVGFVNFVGMWLGMRRWVL